MPFENSSVAIFGTQTQSLGNLFNGNEASARLDYNWNASNRMFAQFNWFHSTDTFGPCDSACTRGFTNPCQELLPEWTVELRAHFLARRLSMNFGLATRRTTRESRRPRPGVPSIYFDDGTAGFGSYSGYPQFFKEHDYSYGDMVSISHGKHSIKVGVDIKRNLENSEFNVARPSYEMFDPTTSPRMLRPSEAAGVDPGFVEQQPGAAGHQCSPLAQH